MAIICPLLFLKKQSQKSAHVLYVTKNIKGHRLCKPVILEMRKLEFKYMNIIY